MGLTDLFLGARPSYQLLPGMDKSIADISSLSFNGLGAAGKSSKKLLKSLDAGEDVSNIGAFAPIRQEEAADLSDIEFDASMGANALRVAGGEQPDLINRMVALNKERRREQTGRQMVGAMADLRRSATDTLTHARDMRDENRLRQQQLLLQARGNVYNNQRSGGILPGLIQGAAQLGSAAILGCWVARELYGETSVEAEMIRSWLWTQAQRDPFWALFVALYNRVGERFASYIRTHPTARRMARFVFDRILAEASLCFDPQPVL
jgi:hypothetical protein